MLCFTYPGRAAAVPSASVDKLRPSQISWKATDADMIDRLRENAVLAAIEAVQRSDNYLQRADYVKDKFKADEDGY